MRAVIQRVKNSSVEVDGKIVGKIDNGLMLLLGVLEGDTQKDADKLAEKIVNLRIFSDEDDKMNLSLLDISGELLVASQFTLCGDCRKGRRPGFDKSAKPDVANKLYEYFKEKCSSLGVKKVESGIFGADMQVSILNDGPVTFVIDCVNGELV